MFALGNGDIISMVYVLVYRLSAHGSSAIDSTDGRYHVVSEKLAMLRGLILYGHVYL